MTHNVKWVDHYREPQEAPNPDYPTGIDLNLCRDSEIGCTVVLPYPAKRCGAYQISCELCRTQTLVTTAGRPDDPRSVTIPCRAKPIAAASRQGIAQ